MSEGLGMRKPAFPLCCPKNPDHDTFIAKVKISEDVILDRNGMVRDTRKFSKHIKPERCAVCLTHLVKWETSEEIAARYIIEMGLDDKEIKEFDIADIRCGLCSNLYDMCDCAETGMR